MLIHGRKIVKLPIGRYGNVHERDNLAKLREIMAIGLNISFASRSFLDTTDLRIKWLDKYNLIHTSLLHKNYSIGDLFGFEETRRFY